MNQKKMKLEIIIESVELKNVLRLLEKKNIDGYTVIEDVKGKGHGGMRFSGDFANVMKNCLIIVVDDEEKLLPVIEEIKIILKNFSGIIFQSEVNVIN